LTGTGQAASAAFTSAGGLTRFHIVIHDPTGARVTLRNANGEMLDLLNEGDAAFERSRTVDDDSLTGTRAAQMIRKLQGP
jgi:hypothetical protein